MDGRSRWDETGGLALLERKLAFGMAAGNAGVAAWIWSRSDPYHIGRPDGSSTLWLDRLTALGRFAKEAEPHLADARPSDVAIVLPQSLQLSVLGHYGVEAQQRCVRALYHEARASADVVGEYQVERLGNPRLILLPSPWVLGERAWDALLERVRGGATLLVTGRFDADEHFRPTGRPRAIGLDYVPRYSCFISYSHQDEEFCKVLHQHLLDHGVKVWFAPEAMRPGHKVHEQINAALGAYDRLLIVLSEASLASDWVDHELHRARRRETKDKMRMLFPVRLVSMNRLKEWELFDADTGRDTAREIREYYIPDFSGWKDPAVLETAIDQLLEGLRREYVSAPSRTRDPGASI
jgi:hypothetical protein